ncbi:EAL domain-containing protein [Paenibacillus thalictri]|uniref:EAL domain-containing protein n=1 Tax=Paenibacillus thalictri TaxID=2527873 RepID=A0A4Q9DZ40_9BACL|nr:EAL domain-containing protein [Paenibacillus thalictri]TBL81188.1 EAL domain-containing protein [Paenibacillus thalictri]
MQKIPVTRDGKRGSDVIIVDSNEVVKIDRIKDREVIIHTRESQYYLDFSFDNLEEWLYEDGFRLLDSSNIVNMNHVEDYDAKKGIVHLGNPNLKWTKSASAARIHKEHIENVMELLKDASSLKQDDGEYEKLYNQRLKDLIEHADEQFLKSYATIRAVNERRKAEEKLVHMAYHDSLTNLPNRTLLHDRLNESFQKSKKDGTSFAVIFFDLDRFKVINDTLGHHVGDQLLQQLARRLEVYVKAKDFVARYSGDEFIFIINDMAHVDEAVQFARGIPTLLKEPFIVENCELFVTSSVGISIYPQDGTESETLLKNADIAMYRSKEKGGNTYQVYHPDMNKRSLHRLNLEVDMRRALERREFSIHYQPLVNLKTGQVFGMECLLRWNHPIWGLVSPGEFIPLAEETGLIIPIGNWVLKMACKQNKEWQEQGYPPLCVSVNISVSQFHQSNFINVVEEALHESGLDPNLLCLEITENIAMQNVPHIIDSMNKLRELGVRISIDDFGTGYSSLSYLKRFRVHTLKIDQSFIRDVTSDEDNAAIVTALIAMSHRLKIKSLAEGVETQEQLAFLIGQGCDEIQGYVFSKPVPAKDFERLLQENKQLYPQ